MRNLKRALSLGLTAAMISGLMVMGSSAASYADVTSEQNQEAIEVLQAVGIMVGDEKGNFNPDQNVTRNEMAVVMSNLMAYNVATYKNTSPFTDVPSWAEPYVAACWTNGITAGYDADTYGGNDTVTTAQAALMLMKALGYFQYESDFGNDWQLAAVSQGNRIDLFEDVDSGVREAMTRNDLAQLVLNTLEAGTVEAETNGSISVGDITIVNDVKYNFVTSGRDYAYSINNKLATDNNGEYSKGSIVELGEKLYQGDLTKKEATDDFGRPANIWDYKTKEVGTFEDEADYTFTAKVTSKALYNEVDKTAVDNYKWSVNVNGDPVDYDGDDLNKNKTDDDKDFLAKVKALGEDGDGNAIAGTGNGVLTQVYVDSTEKTVDVAIINYYAAEVLKVDEDDEDITLSALYGPAKTTDTFDTTDFAEDDIVVYTYANGEIQSVQAAEKMEGEVTRVRTNTADGEEKDGDNFVVDGTTYKYNATMTSDRLATENVNNDVVAYLDPFGYVAYIDESAVSYDYAYVLSMGKGDDNYGGGALGETYYARLVLTDGTMVKVETDSKNINLEHHLVSYSVDKNDVYTLTDKSGKAIETVGTDLKIENGVAGFNTNKGERYTANSNTVFVIAESDDDSLDDYDYTVYTGVKNVPDIDGRNGTKAVVATEKDSKVAKVVYIQDADVAGTGEVIFVETDADAKLIKDSELGNYYEIEAVVDGQVKTLNVKQNSSADTALIADKGIVALKSVTENSDGLVTSVREYKGYDKVTGDGFIEGSSTQKAEKDTVGLDGTRYSWTDDVVVVRYDYKGDFSTSRISSIKNDPNDKFVAVLDGDVITGICILEVEDGENGGSSSGNAGSFDYDVTVSKGGVASVKISDFEWPTDKVVKSVDISFNLVDNDGVYVAEDTITLSYPATSGVARISNTGYTNTDRLTIEKDSIVISYTASAIEKVEVVDAAGDGVTAVKDPKPGVVLNANVTMDNGTVIYSYPADSRVSYKWILGDDQVVGTESSYTVTEDGNGKALSVEVTVGKSTKTYDCGTITAE